MHIMNVDENYRDVARNKSGHGLCESQKRNDTDDVLTGNGDLM